VTRQSRKHKKSLTELSVGLFILFPRPLREMVTIVSGEGLPLSVSAAGKYIPKPRCATNFRELLRSIPAGLEKVTNDKTIKTLKGV